MACGRERNEVWVDDWDDKEVCSATEQDQKNEGKEGIQCGSLMDESILLSWLRFDIMPCFLGEDWRKNKREIHIQILSTFIFHTLALPTFTLPAKR